MEYNSVPSLFNLSAVKIAIRMCDNSEIRSYAQKFGDDWKAFVKEKATLGLPTNVQTKVTCILRPIILEIDEFMENHEYLLNSGINLLSHICWKSEGTIDRKKTAITLIGNENLEIRKRFILACNHCLKDEIWDLWNAMPENEQVLLDSNILIVNYWITWLKSGTEPLRYWSKLSHTVDTLPYFLQKLKSAGKCWSVMISLFPEIIYAEEPDARERLMQNRIGFDVINSVHPMCVNSKVIRLFFSHMTKDQQIKLVESSPIRVLECFLNWPLQNSFMAVLKDIWAILSEENYLSLLQLILYKKIAFGFEDFDYVGLLKEIWHESPEHFKAYVKENDIFPQIKNTMMYGVCKPFTRQKLWQTAMYIAFKWAFQKNNYMCYSLKHMMLAAGASEALSEAKRARLSLGAPIY